MSYFPPMLPVTSEEHQTPGLNEPQFVPPALPKEKVKRTTHKHRRVTCKFCGHQFGVGNAIAQHERTCATRTPAEREHHFKTQIDYSRRYNKKKKNAEPGPRRKHRRKNINSVTPLRASQAQFEPEPAPKPAPERTVKSELAEVLALAQELMRLSPGDRQALLELIRGV